MAKRWLATSTNGAVVLYLSGTNAPWYSWTADKSKARKFADKRTAMRYGAPVAVKEKACV